MAQVVGNSRNVEGCRMSADERPTMRVRSSVGITGGFVEATTMSKADLRAHEREREIASRKAARKARRHRNRKV